MSNDVDLIRRNVSLSDTARSFGVDLQAVGREFVGCCPIHSENTPSFKIFTGNDHVERFQCFGCGEKGDVLDFVQAVKGVDLPEAIRILGGAAHDRPNVEPIRREVRDVYEGIVPLDPVGEIVVGKLVRLYNPKNAGEETQWGRFTPSHVFPYRRADGSLVGYVLRRTMRDGGKETPMVMWVRLPDGAECWSRFPFPKPRPLYGLDKLRDGQVILVEGEKCVDAMRSATGRNVVTWPGGTYGVNHVDWKPLAGRSVVIWPDADDPGLRTAEVVAGKLDSLNATPRVLNIMGA